MANAPRIAVIAGSLRTGSFNKRLADAAQAELMRLGADVTRVALEDYPLPLMDEDLEREQGHPENARTLARLLPGFDGLFLASPEYNASIPPLVKNTIDWISRVRPDRAGENVGFNGLSVAIGAASDGAFGGMRCLYHLRAVLMNVGAEVVTAQCAVSFASRAFGEDGSLVNERQASMLRKTCRSLADHATLLRRA